MQIQNKRERDKSFIENDPESSSDDDPEEKEEEGFEESSK